MGQAHLQQQSPAALIQRIGIAHPAGQVTRLLVVALRQLLDFSRRRGAKLGPANLRQLVTRTLDLLSSAAEARGVTLECRPGEDPMVVQVDQNQVQQALTNVIMNGIQAMPNGGRITIALSARQAQPPGDPDAPEGQYFCVTVEDEGSGIPRDQLPFIFEPFFTTKGVGEGTGLGLSVAYGIIAEHGGWISVESEVGRGSRFSVFLRPAGGAQALVEVAS